MNWAQCCSGQRPLSGRFTADRSCSDINSSYFMRPGTFAKIDLRRVRKVKFYNIFASHCHARVSIKSITNLRTAKLKTPLCYCIWVLSAESFLDTGLLQVRRFYNTWKTIYRNTALSCKYMDCRRWVSGVHRKALKSFTALSHCIWEFQNTGICYEVSPESLENLKPYAFTFLYPET